MSKFMVHKHHAKNLHWDFRLEVSGVLKSWAVPKEPSATAKRLAIAVQDHSLEYGNFKGTIPEGEYGAGKVEIWDSGSYKNIKEEGMESCLKNGRIEIELKGKRMKGNYALIRTNYHRGKKNANWLLFKMKK